MIQLAHAHLDRGELAPPSVVVTVAGTVGGHRLPAFQDVVLQLKFERCGYSRSAGRHKHTTASPRRKEHKYTSPLSTNCPVGKSPLHKTAGARKEPGRQSQPSSHLSCSIIAAMPAGQSPMQAHREQLLHTTSNSTI